MHTKQNLGIERGQCSFYRNVKVKENVLMHISEFVNLIRTGKWKSEITGYRQLMRDGKTEEAGRIKSNLPAILVAGECDGGHTKANFRKFSGELVLDVDGCNEKTRELLQLLKEQPWVRAGWVSVSDNGFKVVVRVDAESPHEFEKQAYPQVAARVQEIIGFPVDKQCKDLTRMCYVSWDEDAFWKEDCEVFPWRENLAECPDSEESESSKNPHSIEENHSSSTSKGTVPEVHGFIAHFFERFCRTHAFVPGSRHDFLLKLGASARRQGFNLAELNQLIAIAEPYCFAPDYAPGEICRNITDSYHFTENRMASENDRLGFKGHYRHHVCTAEGIQEEEATEEDKEELSKEQAKKMRMQAPCLPDWIYEELPELLKKGVSVTSNRRQRDMLLLSMLTNLSACMPNVRMLYDDAFIYPHLFLAVIAPSATGKGIMAHAARLAKMVQKDLDENNRQRQKEFEEAWAEWELEHAQAFKEKRKPDMSKRPDPILRETLIVPADVSRTQFIQLMAGSPQGMLLNTSEFDTLCSAMKAEYAKFDDLLRACFHHEMFGSDFKTDKRSFHVYTPKLAFCGSGTPSQFYRLCPSIENGSYSRYLIYLAEQEMDFRMMAPGKGGTNRTVLFNQLSSSVLDMYRYLKAYPTEITLSADQWQLHEAFFQSYLQQVKMEEVEGPVSVVFRYGLSTARLAMIFTCLRKFEAQWSFRDICCTDEDFQLALAIMETLLSHSLMFSTSLHKVKSSPNSMRKYFKVRLALEKLKPEFTYTELIEALMSEGLPETTARRYRKRLLEMQIIVQEEDKYRFTTRKWRVKFDKVAPR